MWATTCGQSELAFISALCKITFFYWQKIAKNRNYLNKKVENEMLVEVSLDSYAIGCYQVPQH
jgi:hypothetical protein